MLNLRIQELNRRLIEHPLYTKLDKIENIRTFMEYHSFAVYDFMVLLKSMQRQMTMYSALWKPSPYPDQIVRFINEIVLCEESDLDADGNPISHFHLYIKAMNEVQADNNKVLNFVGNIKDTKFDASDLPPGVQEFVSYNLNLALHGELEEVAGAFLFGREKLVPEMFKSIVKVLDQKELYPAFMHYLERHIQVDGEEHGPMAEKCLAAICSDEKKYQRAINAAITSLELRLKLWDACLKTINQSELK